MLPGVMQTGKNLGMVTMDDSLKALYNRDLATQDECLSRANDKGQMKKHFNID